jgi:outer membrane receptor protein involved in Fe transport
MRSPRTLLAALASLGALGSTTNAQTLPSAQSAATASSGDKGIVSLSPFTVSSAGDEGYRAQNTLAGSRLNSSLNDTPGVLDVLTKDFLDDIGAMNLEQALAFSANFEVDNGDFESQGVINTIFAGPAATPSFRTRGLVGTLARNYLETDFRPGFYTIERIDNASGPNSVLFGLGSAGGVANVSTKAAKLNRNAYGVDFPTDGFGSKQVALDLNQVLRRERLGLRLNAISSRLNKYRAHFSDNIDGVQLASTWRAGERTEVQVEFERAHVTGSVAYPVPHIDQASRWLALGSPVATLPVGWESLTAAARTAVATPLALAANAVTVAPVLVDNPGYGYILNSATALSGTTAVGGLNRQTINPALFNPRGNINGPGGRKEVDRQIFAVSINQKLRENLHLNLSAARESGDAETWQAYANGAAGGATILGDANATLPNASQILTLGATKLNTNTSGQVINPFAGQFYTQSRWVRRLQSNERAIVQATGALQVNLGRWLGDHRVVGTASYSERVIASESQRENLYKFTMPMAEQLRAYIDDLQKKNPGVNVSGLSTASDPTTIAESLNNLDERLDLATGNNSTNYGGGGYSINLAASYDFQRFLKGFGVTGTVLYKSGAYAGVYDIREGGVATGKLLGTKPLIGESMLDLGLNLRYRTRLAWLRNTRVTFQLNVRNLLDETDPISRRAGRMVVAPGAPVPTILRDGSMFVQYFLRDPRALLFYEDPPHGS